LATDVIAFNEFNLRLTDVSKQLKLVAAEQKSADSELRDKEKELADTKLALETAAATLVENLKGAAQASSRG
jgi:hypothetical protein